MKKTKHFTERQASRGFSDKIIDFAIGHGVMHVQKDSSVVYELTKSIVESHKASIQAALQQKQNRVKDAKCTKQDLVEERRDIKKLGKLAKRLRPCFVVIATDKKEQVKKLVSVGTPFKDIRGYELLA